MSNREQSLLDRIKYLEKQLFQIGDDTICPETACAVKEILSEPWLPALDEEDLEDWLDEVRVANISPLAPR
jgi:hypothetical protein